MEHLLSDVSHVQPVDELPPVAPDHDRVEVLGAVQYSPHRAPQPDRGIDLDAVLGRDLPGSPDDPLRAFLGRLLEVILQGEPRRRTSHR